MVCPIFLKFIDKIVSKKYNNITNLNGHMGYGSLMAGKGGRKMKNGKKLLSKLTALTLAMLMSLSLVPITAAAAAAPDITVKLTVSDKGTLAKAKDGSPMAWKEVTVKDLNEDGQFTVDEALVAAHKAYNSEDGFVVKSGSVRKLWGEGDGEDFLNSLFFVNGEGLPTGVSDDTVKAGDYLTASVNADPKYYGDWYAGFDENEKEAEVGKEVTLTLKGHLGMAYTDEEKVDVPLPKITVTDADGKELGTTDANGKVSFKPDKAGEIIVTASGVAKEKPVTDWGLIDLGGDPKVYGTMDFETGDSSVAYTEADHGNGPYPAAEIKYIDFFDWSDLTDDEQAAYHVLHSNILSTDCPIMAPACIITVKEAAKTDPTPAPAKKPLAKGKTFAAGKNKFKVSSSSAKAPAVTYTKPAKKTLKSANVPATVKHNGITYKVTAIANNAFKNNKKLKKVTIGANVKSIGKAAFAGDKNLKTIVVKSKVLKKVGKNALKGINKKAVIKVNKKVKKKYTKLFKKKGQAKSVKVK